MEALRAHKDSGAFLQTCSAALSSLAGCPLPSDLYFNGFAMFIAWWQNQVSYAQGLSLHSMNMQHSLTEKFKHFLSVLMWGMRWACPPRHLADSIFFSWSVSTFCTSVLSKISRYFLIFQYLQHHHQYYLLFISCNNFPPQIYKCIRHTAITYYLMQSVLICYYTIIWWVFFFVFPLKWFNNHIILYFV